MRQHRVNNYFGCRERSCSRFGDAWLASHAMPWAVITRFTRCPCRRDLSKLEQLQTERLDLRNDAEHRGPILEQAGEHGFASCQLRHHRGKGGEGRRSEPALYPDRVHARRCGHSLILHPDLVSRQRQNLVIVRTRYFGDVRERPDERSRNSRAR
jgi:hypothetical protein